MENNIIVHDLDLELRIMTAVHVWSGYKYVVSADSYVRNNKLYILDPDKLALISTENRQILDEIIFGSTTLAGIVQKYRLPIDNISKQVIEIQNALAAKTPLIKEVMANSRIKDTPSLPGSEIKGLFRTAILFDLVDKMVDNKQFYKQLKDQMDYVAENCKVLNAGLPIEALLRGFIGVNPYDIMHYIQISDPYISDQKTIIDSIVTIHRSDPKSVIAEAYVEALTKGSTYRYKILITKPVSKEMVMENIILDKLDETAINGMLNKYNRILDLDNILDSLKKFSEKLLTYEIGILEGFENKGFDLSIIDEIKKWLNEVRGSNNVFYLKIGYGAGHYSKTVYLALPDDLKKFLKQFMTRCRRMLWDDVSYRVLGSQYHQGRIIPFAWVRLEIREVE